MNEQQIRWDDLQIVLAIAEAGSLSGASRTLRISHATVFRRLNELERGLRVTLFERSRTGYTQPWQEMTWRPLLSGCKAKSTGWNAGLLGKIQP